MVDLTGYTLTFSDEFDSRSISQTGAGTTWADIRSEWRFDANSDIGFGRSSFVDPASGYDPFQVKDGILTITAVPDKTPFGHPGSWESGLITTQGGFSQTYGYFEIRADMSGAKGAWDAFWLLPDVQVKNPLNTQLWQEIDIVEHYGNNDRGVYSYIHNSDLDKQDYSSTQSYAETAIAEGYHTYGLLWTEKTISFYLDGVVTATKNTPSDMHSPMYIIANLAVETGVDPENLPISMKIDYIRAYSATVAVQSPSPLSHIGTAGPDTLIGNDKDEMFKPLGGNNIVDGGAGFDTLALAGARSTYSLMTADGWTYLTGEEGATRMMNVEQVSFAGETVAFSALATSLTAFSGLRYAASYSDLSTVFGTDAQAATLHYINTGFGEGRDAKRFNPLDYTASSADLITAFGINEEAATQHYIVRGRAEGRSVDSFDGWQYAASHADLSATFGTNADAAARHYIQYGKAEGRSADSFDGLRYIASNADLIVAFGSDDDTAAWHYLTAGRSEGRSLNAFDPLKYAAANLDLSKAFGTNAEALTQHYIDYGFSEHRSIGSSADFFIL